MPMETCLYMFEAKYTQEMAQYHKLCRAHNMWLKRYPEMSWITERLSVIWEKLGQRYQEVARDQWDKHIVEVFDAVDKEEWDRALVLYSGILMRLMIFIIGGKLNGWS